MINSNVRCMIVDLEKQTFECKEWTGALMSDGLGTYAIYLEELKPCFKQDTSAVALSTGPLTGTGIPGSGGMAWCWREDGTWRICETEGRLGAILRNSGVDHLILQGTCKELVNLYLTDGEISFSKAVYVEEEAIWEELIRKRPDTDSVVAFMGADGVKEDKYFTLAPAELSDLLKRKGLHSLTITGKESIEISNHEEFLKQCVKLCQDSKSTANRSPAAGRQYPARYLSINHFVSLEGEEEQLPPMALSLFGLCWDESFLGEDMWETAASLISSYTGRQWKKEELIQIKEQLGRGMKRDVEKKD